jgi:cytochrome c-type biogenesis protein
MPMTEGSWIVALAAGALGFLSPCVLPLIPGYVAFVSGVSVADPKPGGPGSLLRVVGGTALFVIGFSLVFTVLGASASLLGGFVGEYRQVLTRAGGVVVVALGLAVLGVVRVPALYRTRRLAIERNRFGLMGALPFGMAFGFAWTPCVGPTLASILTLAASASTVAGGAALLFAYSLGLGIPFMLTAVVLSSAMAALRTLVRHGRAIERVSGAFLVLMGLVMVTDYLFVLNSWILSIVPIRPGL